MLTSVMAMVALRAGYGVINFLAAFLIYFYGTAEAGLRINTMVGVIGPIIFMIVTYIGMTGGATALQPYKIVLIVLGVCLIFLGTRG